MSVTPDFVGQRYKDTNTGNIWRANSTTPGDWTLEVQNMKIGWTPLTAPFYDECAIDISVGTFTNLVLNQTTIGGIFSSSSGALSLETLSCPNLLTLDSVNGAGLYITTAPALTSVEFPSLVSFPGNLTINNCPELVTIDLRSVVDTASLSNKRMYLQSNPKLTTIRLDAFIGTLILDLNASGCALNVATVNQILARCVITWSSGNILLNGGTSAAPSGQGIIDKNTLIARGVNVVTN